LGLWPTKGIRNDARTHTRSKRIDGGIPLQRVTGVDISNYLDFGFYDDVVNRDNAGLSKSKIGRWLGVAENFGTMMTFYVLTRLAKSSRGPQLSESRR
jgi:hypothetical protein